MEFDTDADVECKEYRVSNVRNVERHRTER